MRWSYSVLKCSLISENFSFLELNGITWHSGLVVGELKCLFVYGTPKEHDWPSCAWKNDVIKCGQLLADITDLAYGGVSVDSKNAKLFSGTTSVWIF